MHKATQTVKIEVVQGG